jgi:hypothetical protein
MSATRFLGDGWAVRIARLCVLEMIIWPGLLFIGGSLYVAWRVREEPVAMALLLFATLFSVAVGVRQWAVMLQAILPARSPQSSSAKEVSPRHTGRGTTGGMKDEG